MLILLHPELNNFSARMSAPCQLSIRIDKRQWVVGAIHIRREKLPRRVRHQPPTNPRVVVPGAKIMQTDAGVKFPATFALRDLRYAPTFPVHPVK